MAWRSRGSGREDAPAKRQGSTGEAARGRKGGVKAAQCPKIFGKDALKISLRPLEGAEMACSRAMDRAAGPSKAKVVRSKVQLAILGSGPPQ